jgi:hypothetical protein
MSQLPQREEIPAPVTGRSPAAALVLWLIGQAILVAAVWCDMRLSANGERRASELGLPLLLAGQLILSTALLVDLACTARTAAMAFAMSFPATQLVGWRCSAGAGVSLLQSAVLLVWFAALLLWMRAFRGERGRRWLAAALFAWVAGLPVLWYVLAEFASGSTLRNALATVSPLMHPSDLPHLLAIAATQALLAGASCLAMHWRRKQA